MSFDNARRARSVSPQPSSGRDSPIPGLRPPRRQLEEEPRKQDKALRRYGAQIERALAQVGAARLEWPDYISFLGRLLKAIQTHPPHVDVLPHRTAVSRRLAQCLNPSLPSGVHQKTLEVYTYIFNLIGRRSLARDLGVFLRGLSSVLTFASLSIRPAYLTLVEDYILPLDATALRPALKALILSLLPGLEEETSEDFEKALGLVEGLRNAVNTSSQGTLNAAHGFGDEYFWQCLFLAAISSSSRRQGVLAYLTRKLPKLGPEASPVKNDNDGHQDRGADDQATATSPLAQSVISPEPGLLIRCFASGLEDEQLLLQRGFLDLLLSHLPLNSPVLTERVEASDLQRLVAAATNVVARRDMSLNRRLWSWFLGPNLGDSEHDSTQLLSPVSPSTLDPRNMHSKAVVYFRRYGFHPLRASLLAMFDNRDEVATDKAKPFRICLSLMDRWEVGTLLVPEVFAPAMSTLLTYSTTASQTDYQELLRSANGFFDGIESGVIWTQIVELVQSALGSEQLEQAARLRNLKLVKLIIANFNVSEEEMVAFHIPLCCVLAMIDVAQREKVNDNSIGWDQEVDLEALSTIERLIVVMPERAQLNTSFGDSHAAQTESNERREDGIVRSIDSFYEEQNGNLTQSPPPFSSQQIADLMLEYGTTLLKPGSQPDAPFRSLELRGRILSDLVMKTPTCGSLVLHKIFSLMENALECLPHSDHDVVPKLLCISHLMLHAFAKGERKTLRSLDLASLIALAIEQLWNVLRPTTPRYHVEAVRCLWQLDSMSPDDAHLESSISKPIGVGSGDLSNRTSSLDSACRFSVLWTHSLSYLGSNSNKGISKTRRESSQFSNSSVQDGRFEAVLYRPLLLLLEILDDEGSDTYFFLLGWLKSPTNLSIVFDLLLTKLKQAYTEKSLDYVKDNKTFKEKHRTQSEECLYYLRLLNNILKHHSEHTWTVLNAESPKLTEAGEHEGNASIQVDIVRICLDVIRAEASRVARTEDRISSPLQCSALNLLQMLLLNPDPSQLKALAIEESLVDILAADGLSISFSPAVQVAMLDAVRGYLRLKYEMSSNKKAGKHSRNTSLEDATQSMKTQPKADLQETKDRLSQPISPPPGKLINCLRRRISSPGSHEVLDSWISFLVEVLPLYADSLFQNLIPLVETFCKQMASQFQQLQSAFVVGSDTSITMSETSMFSLLNGLEHVLAIAHGRLVHEENAAPSIKSPEQVQGFFGNVVSGVFANESSKVRGNVANSRLTVVLSLQDAVRVCFSIWSWGAYGPRDKDHDPVSAASFAYTASRYRNRARRLLDRMFFAEPLECLETLIAYQDPGDSSAHASNSAAIALFHALDGARPKRLMPAYFNALYSRTNPSALEAGRMSTLTNDVRDVDIGASLIDYTKSLDDDAMDEIWTDCMTFLKDVLSNPLQHSTILPLLLLFLITLAEKVERTNFGEQRRMKKELSDLFLRLLTAAFTSRAAVNPNETQSITSDDNTSEQRHTAETVSLSPPARPTAMVDVLVTIVPRLRVALVEPDKLNIAIANISSNVSSPLIHSRTFPVPITSVVLKLLQEISKVAPAAKSWRKDVTEMFNHQKLFSCRRNLIEGGLVPVIRSWAMQDKDRISEILGRIAAPTSAGIMFGVGASAARLDADKRIQLNLRRIALLVLALENDSAVAPMSAIEEKVTELFGATPASSPSSSTRAEVFMMLQAIALKTSPVHLVSLWPLIAAELEKAIGCAIPGAQEYDTYNTLSLLQACKLLDLLLLVAPDEFQTYEWLFITDTIDAVYRPAHWEPTGLVDELAEELGSVDPVSSSPKLTGPALDQSSPRSDALQRTLLSTKGGVADMKKEEFVQNVSRPFFSQLSIHSFEATYSMAKPDVRACEKALLDDLFDDGTILG